MHALGQAAGAALPAHTPCVTLPVRNKKPAIRAAQERAVDVVPFLSAEFQRPGVGRLHFWGSSALGRLMSRAESDPQSNSCWARSGVSGRVWSNSSPLVRWADASWYADRSGRFPLPAADIGRLGYSRPRSKCMASSAAISLARSP